MALDLTGIKNVGDFYSPHYLEELLENDLKGLLERWRKAKDEHGKTPPPDRLRGVGKAFFAAKAKAMASDSDRERWRASRDAHARLIEALGYERKPGHIERVDEDTAVPVIARVWRDGRPYLWIVEARFPKPDEPVLDMKLLPDQLTEDGIPVGAILPEGTLEDLPEKIFAQLEPPRWVVLLCGGEIVLAERGKWGQGKYLGFDVDELLGRGERRALEAAAALLSKDALCPDDGIVLHDTLDENSHKHAYAVSEDLKFGVRNAVELLANEFVWYRRNVSKEKLFGDDALAAKLKAESLRYLYRLLFLLYAEARGEELDILPMKSSEYRLGYSFESLRDLEQVSLTTDRARNGYFLHDSLEKLFELVQSGHGYVAGAQEQQLSLAAANPADAEIYDRGFSIRALRADLFDPARTPLFASVKFRNCVLQEVIRNLSLSREAGKAGKKKQRGRISYAQLGINQLGAVYEGLLSFTGFFAEEPLYEVRPAGTKDDDDTTQHYFIPESAVGDYTDDEFVTVESPDGSLTRKVYAKGSFIFRLAGRDRQQSASYYTPEVLTRCVVKYSLKELLKDKTADEILELTVCEPAMGSGAFLNEAVNQLADAYLERKQKEIGRILPAADYPLEKKRVMAHIALNNVYGVDLNPTATELAAVSLWLNIIHKDLPAPWFGLRLAVGNSLIGARRRVFESRHLTGGGKKKPKADDLWLKQVPRDVPLAETIPEKTVFHFLVGDDGMARYEGDKILKDLAPDEIAAIKSWRKEFNAPYTKEEVARLDSLTVRAASLWEKALADRLRAVRRTRRQVPVWPSDGATYTHTGGGDPDLERRILERPNGPYRRLELLMDAWSALWFWPIRDAHLLPTRNEWLDMVGILVAGRREETKGQVAFDFLRNADEEARQLALAFVEEHGLVDVDALCERTPWLAAAQRVAKERRFHHWELAFGEVFAERGGFDLTVGNPPWVKVEWEEGVILADLDPRIALRGESASEIAKRRRILLGSSGGMELYTSAAGAAVATKTALSAAQWYPLLKGIQTNLYKCFVTQGWLVGNDRGVVGLLHPDGIYDDPKAGALREITYRRLAFHAQFMNALSLFTGTNDHGLLKFAVHVYRARCRDSSTFDHLSNVFHPTTIDDSYGHDGAGAVPGIKNPDDNFRWDLRGHQSRIVKIDHDALAAFARLYDGPDTPPLRGRLPMLHSGEVLAVLRRLAQQKQRLEDRDYFSTVMFDETYAQRDGTIRQETRFPKDATEWILSGSHYFVATPFCKTPNENGGGKMDFSPIDLAAIPDDFLPRTNYVPACAPAEYLARTPKWNGQPVTAFYRHVHREMVDAGHERTLRNVIIPPGVAHHNVSFTTIVELQELPFLAAMCSSLPVDFLMKVSGKGHINESLIAKVPLPATELRRELSIRALRLNCLTSHYAALWNELVPAVGSDRGFISDDPRLDSWANVPSTWTRHCALRTDLDRRQALLELDALAALALGLTLDELLTIYRVQFPVLQRYEHENRYDESGRLVPDQVLRIAEQQGIDVNVPGPGIRWTDPKMYPLMEREYVPPFTRHDREEDMASAYRVFEKRLATKGAA